MPIKHVEPQPGELVEASLRTQLLFANGDWPEHATLQLMAGKLKDGHLTAHIHLPDDDYGHSMKAAVVDAIVGVNKRLVSQPIEFVAVCEFAFFEPFGMRNCIFIVLKQWLARNHEFSYESRVKRTTRRENSDEHDERNDTDPPQRCGAVQRQGQLLECRVVRRRGRPIRGDDHCGRAALHGESGSG